MESMHQMSISNNIIPYSNITSQATATNDRKKKGKENKEGKETYHKERKEEKERGKELQGLGRHGEELGGEMEWWERSWQWKVVGGSGGRRVKWSLLGCWLDAKVLGGNSRVEAKPTGARVVDERLCTASVV